MKFASTAIIMLFSPLVLFSQTKPRYALVIGNANYSQGRLKNPGNDADTIENRLQKCGFAVTVRKNLKQFSDFKSTVDSFYNKINKHSCEVFFYYSGHGIQQDGQNYLIPTEAEINSFSDVSDYCFPLRTVLGKLEDSKSTTNIVVLDACRNNPFSRGLRGPGDKGLQAVTQELKESFIIYATSPNSVAADGRGKNSPMVSAFASNILQPGLSINDLLLRITDDVNRQVPTQRPWGSVSMRKQFYFVPSTSESSGNGQTKSISGAAGKNIADIVFITNVACSLFVDDDYIIALKAGIQQPLSVPAGNHKVRAVALEDTSVQWESEFYYTPENTNVSYLDLQLKLVEKISELNNDPRTIRRRKAIQSIGQGMTKIKSGEFSMGNNSGNNDESPEHKAILSSYYISRYEITQEQWSAIMGDNPSGFGNCSDCPVENVSWNEVARFIDTLNKLSGEKYRLPTEAEWEYAARGGGIIRSASDFSGGGRVDKLGWVYKNSSKKTHPAGELAGNEQGIHDMTGNVAEWCHDWYDGAYYKRSKTENPQGPDNGKEKVIRGGSWNDEDSNCRNSTRDKRPGDYKNKSVGFRVCQNNL